MADLGRSPTQRVLEPRDVARLVASSSRSRMVDCSPMSGGGYAAVWRVHLDDGRVVVLKVAPAPSVRLLSYERDLLTSECRYYRFVAAHAPGLPLPRVLHVGREPDIQWMFMTLLPGRPLTELAELDPDLDDAAVRRDLGAALARLHAITGDRYGYDGGRTSGSSWRRAFRGMVRELLADAEEWGVDLPAPAARIQHLVDRNSDVLDAVTRPAVLHFDTWDGNVLAAPGPDGALRLTGLVDGERHLCGDPLMDLVSAALHRRIEDPPPHPVLVGYAGGTGRSTTLDPAARRRLALYRLHLHLLMVVEMPSRGMGPLSHPGRQDRLARLLDQQLRDLDASRTESG